MSCLRRHMCWQSKRFYWERAPGESSRVREPRRTALPHGLPHGLGITVMGLVSWLSLANHSDSESCLVVHTLFSHDGCQREGFWEVVGHVVSPFDLSRTLLVGGGLLVPCSLPGPPVINSSCKWWLWCLARVGGFSQCASPHRWRGLKCFEHLLCARYCARHFVYFN